MDFRRMLRAAHAQNAHTINLWVAGAGGLIYLGVFVVADRTISPEGCQTPFKTWHRAFDRSTKMPHDWGALTFRVKERNGSYRLLSTASTRATMGATA